MTQTIIIFVAITFIFFNRLLYKKMFTLPSIITLIWCSTLYLANFGLFEVFVPSFEVTIYALTFVTSFNIFSFIFSIFYTKRKKTITEISNMEINSKLLSQILIILIIALIFIYRKSLLLFITTGNFNTVRNAYINWESIDNYMQVFTSITISPIGKALYILSIIDYVNTKKIKSNLILSLIFVFLSMLLTAGRGIAVNIVLIFLISLWLKEKSLKNIVHNNKKIVKYLFLFVIILTIVTNQRNLSGGNLFTSLYVYFCGCFNLFGVYLEKNLVFGESLMYGQALISGFSFPIIQLIRYVFKIDILPGNYLLEELATGKYIAISPTIAINATPTSMFAAIRDFGELGLIIYPLVIAFFYTKLKNAYKNKNNLLTEAFFVFFISEALFLNMSYNFGKFQTSSIFIYMFIIYKISKKKEKNYVKKNN